MGKGNKGGKLVCVSCQICVHDICVPELNKEFACGQSFRQNVRKYREQNEVQHHWVKKKNVKGRCHPCNGSIFGSAMSCSWCKRNYHEKESCKKAMENNTRCDMGEHFKSIVPPTWIVKVPPKGNFKNSLKACPLKGRNGEVIKVPPLATVQENAVNKMAGKKDEKK